MELWKRVVKLKKEGSLNIWENGDYNLYPYEIEGVIRNSPTATRVVGLLETYISGSGVEDNEGNLIDWDELPFVNPKKGYKITDVIRLASNPLAIQNGVFFHVGYGLDEDLNPIPKTLDVLSYSDGRKLKYDDDDNSGKLVFRDFSEKGFKSSKKDLIEFYPFNSNPKVVKAQIFKDKETDDITEAIEDYNGQVFYLNLNPEQIYASSNFDSVYNDMDTEYRISLYANSESRIGFLGKTIFITQGLDDEQQEKVQKDLATFMGAEGSANMYHMDVENADNLDQVLKVIQLTPQFDDNLFEITQKRIRTNILGVAGNISERLAFAGDGIFSASGEALLEDKIALSENTEYLRTQLERALAFMGFPTKIVPLVTREEDGL